jgi:hypothetical protein
MGDGVYGLYKAFSDEATYLALAVSVIPWLNNTYIGYW